jgi:hypothetical protein
MPAELGEASHGTLTRPPPAAQAELLALYNASHWPKHLLVQYTWRPLVQVDTAGGLLLVLLGGACKTHRLHTVCELLRQCGALLDSTHHSALVGSLGSATSRRR